MALPYLAPTTIVNVTFNTSAGQTPYLLEHFNTLKLVGENRHDFVKRLHMKLAKEWWSNKQIADSREANRTAIQALVEEAEVFNNL